MQRPSPRDDDRELARRFARGDAGAFDEVVYCYGQRVIALAARLLAWEDGAHDVAQDVFLMALKHQRSYRARAGLWPWLATMTVNRCRSVQRRRWLQRRVLGKLTLAMSVTGPASGERPRIVRDETAVEVRAAVARLPALSREVIVLRYLEELSIDEMADVLRMKRNAIEVRLTRARRKLKGLLRHLVDE